MRCLDGDFPEPPSHTALNKAALDTFWNTECDAATAITIATFALHVVFCTVVLHHGPGTLILAAVTSRVPV